MSHTLQLFVRSWKSGIHAYRASVPNPSVQQLCWPVLNRETSCSVVTTGEVGIAQAHGSVGSSCSHSQSHGWDAWMNGQEESQVPVTNTKPIPWFYSLTPLESICLLFLFLWTYKYPWVPRLVAGQPDREEQRIVLTQPYLYPDPAEDGALLSGVSSTLAVGSKGHYMSCAVSARGLGCPQVFKMALDTCAQAPESFPTYMKFSHLNQK